MFTVVITEKGGSQRRVECEESEVTIGRVQGNDVVLPKGNVSKRHSRIVLRDNRFIVVDLKSTNGTYVNGRKITSPLVVKEGDKIYIGDFILTLQARAQSKMPSKAPEPMRPPSALPPVLGNMDSEPPPSSGPSETLGGSPSGLPSRPPAAPSVPSGLSDPPERSADLSHLMGRLERNLESMPPARPTSRGPHSMDEDPPSFDASILGDLRFLGRFAELLYDGSVQRIEVARHDRVWVDRGRGPKEDASMSFAAPHVLDAALRKLAQAAAVPLDAARSANFELLDGTHVSVLWPPLASAGPSAVFCRRPQTVRSLAELQNANMLDGKQAQQLRAAVSERDNVLVVGPRRANAIAVANALVAQLEAGARVVTLERSAEIGPRERVHLGLRWPATGLQELLPHAETFEADRWVLHDAPASEAALLVPLLAGRSDGSVCTLCAPSVRDALDDLRAHAGPLGERMESLLASAFPVVVELGLEGNETRVRSVAKLRMQGGRASAA